MIGDDKEHTIKFKVEDSGSLRKNQSNSNFEIKDTWIPEKAKKNYHEQRLNQSKWAFRLSFLGEYCRIFCYYNKFEH